MIAATPASAGDPRRTLAENLLYLDATRRVLKTLSDGGVRAMPLKGVFFSLRFHGDLGVRPQSDVDVLVRRGDREKAHGALTADGWREAAPRDFYRDHYHWVYAREGVLLELHWALRSPGLSSPDVERLWSAARTARREGTEILEWTPEDTLLYLAVNKAQQHYNRPMDFLDVSLVARRVTDWGSVVARALEEGVAPALWFGLAAATETGGAPVPASVMGRLEKAAGAARAAFWIRRRMGWTRWFPAGPWARLHEAALEGTLRKAWALFRPLLFPSRARVEVVGSGSRIRYYARLLSP